MRSFILSSILIVLLFSCKGSKTAVTGEERRPLKSDELISLFKSDSGAFVYKTAVDVYGHYLSGLLIIKNTEPDKYRLVFTTEVGVKLFDFELGPSDFFKVHYCIDQMNKKVVINLLRDDFRLLLMNPLIASEAVVSKDSTHVIYRLRGKKEENAYFYKLDDGKLSKIMTTYGKKSKTKVEILFTDYSGEVPSNILLDHQNIKLTIKMSLLKR
ncbi:MAG: hypothetical protein J7604_08785 [Sporocytophaga sp.]|uniref:hypothetical protein n=1 Tax=Sporocytophaga sp. TaxID=2231183 RepID=UPI001B27D831|nr:hypothetical protein [Sporocytophaga sp.]MBO9700293.1 hypothetical protein [Sporocytophaga sp.]